jgi:hypothetical protein
LQQCPVPPDGTGQGEDKHKLRQTREHNRRVRSSRAVSSCHRYPGAH